MVRYIPVVQQLDLHWPMHSNQHMFVAMKPGCCGHANVKFVDDW